jgi:two-component system response regulator HydG
MDEDKEDRPHREQSGGGERWFRVEELAAGGERVGQLVGQSALMRGVFEALRWLAPYKTTVLIQGESGTGKELAARALHTLGPTPKGPFVIFNCSNLMETLAESQLFGHVRGAFTDAREEAPGCFRAAHGGTLFLDEIGELPLKLQAKLLRAVETYEVQPVGAAHSYQVNIRLVVATNRDLRQLVKERGFRDDLFYRLNATAITLPPLRRHPDDIPLLAAHFITHYNRLFDKHVRLLAQRALELLTAYPWPGNVRELAHAIEHAVLFAPGERLEAAYLPTHLNQPTSAERAVPTVSLPAGDEDLADGFGNVTAGGREAYAEKGEAVAGAVHGEEYLSLSFEENIKQALLRSLRESKGNRCLAASLLGVSRSTLYRMMWRHGLGDSFKALPGYRHRRPQQSRPNSSSGPSEVT